MLGYQPPELLGKSAYEFYHPDDHSNMKESFEQGKVQMIRLIDAFLLARLHRTKCYTYTIYNTMNG